MSTGEHSGHLDDTAVTQTWRRASGEAPPAAVDEAILAAARAAASVSRSDTPVSVHRRLPTPRPVARNPWWTRWQPLVAAASVVGIAFVLVQRLPTDTEPAHETSAPLAGKAAPDAPAAEPAQPEHAAVTGSDQPPAETAASAPARAESAARATPQATLDVARASGVAEFAAPPATAGPSQETLPAAEDWARRIEQLYRAGSPAEAATELQRFRAAYPDADHWLAPQLRPWAATVAE